MRASSMLRSEDDTHPVSRTILSLSGALSHLRPAHRFGSFLTDRLALGVCLLVYLIVAVLYGVTIPIFETPDANGHYAYIHELTEGRGLPVQGAPSGKRVTGYVASHPPLYYALCAVLTFWVPDDADFEDWAWRNPHQTMGDASRPANKNILIHTAAERFPWKGTPLVMHISRLVSTLLGAVAVLATYGIAKELFPEQRWLAVGATALAAFNPMFVFTSARVSNDAAVTAFGSLAVWAAVRLTVKGLTRRGLILAGAAVGLAVLSKLSGLIFAPVVALALLFDGVRRWQEQPSEPFRKHLVGILRRSALVGVPALAVSGWWFVRNLMLYHELMGVDAWLSHTATVRPEPISVLNVIPELRGLEKSYWAMFGWFNISVAPWMYRFWWLLSRTAAVGLLVTVVDQWSPSRYSRSLRQGLLIIASAFLFNVASVWRFIMIVLGAQGRYLMPTIAPISILLILGLRRLVPRGTAPIPWKDTLSGILGGTHVALTLISLFVFILPAYAKPVVVAEDDLPEAMTRLDLSFNGGAIELLGGRIETEDAHPGDTAALSLYWRATEPPEENYFTFVQILGREMDPIAGVDCYPGGGTFPPTLWEPGVIYRDRYELPIAAGAEVPTAGRLHVGLYTRDGNRLSIDGSSEPSSELVVLDRMAVRPREPLSDDAAQPVGARLGEAIRLVGYDLSASNLEPGDVVTVTLVWRAEAPIESDLTGFIHLVDENGTLVTQSDHPPLDGAYPTSLWQPGDVVRDSYQLRVTDGTTCGACRLAIGMYNPQTQQRLPVYGESEGTRLENDLIVTGQVTIE